MRHARDFGEPESDGNYLHVISRFLERRFLLDTDEEKEQFKEWMFLYAKAFDIQIVTYVLMSSHIHILAFVKNGHDDLRALSDDELLERLAPLYTEPTVQNIREQLAHAREQGFAEQFREKYIRRMRNLSTFVGELKQRFSRYYNRKEERKGPVWEDRFKSVLVENTADVLRQMAAYIDLNPVRAGIVSDPADYRWCGYAEAVSGCERAQSGLLHILSEQSAMEGMDVLENWTDFRETYRFLLFEGAIEVLDENGKTVRKGISLEEARKVLNEGGRISGPGLLHLRVRYWVDGVAIGSKAFVERAFERVREKWKLRRTEGARSGKTKGIDLGELFTLRDLRGKVSE